MNELLSLAQSFGWQGLAIAVGILVLVFAARKAGIVATGNHARIANIIIGAILYGLSGDPTAETALLSTISSILAGLAYEGLQFAGKKLKPPAG